MEFNPQGTLAERLRAGGAGIPAFYTATGVGTMVAEGKPEAVFDGKRYIQERGIVADLALVHAHTGDIDGNLVYRLTAQNFNPLCAASGKVTIAEVEHLVGRGEIAPDRVQTPGVYIDHIIQAQPRESPLNSAPRGRGPAGRRSNKDERQTTAASCSSTQSANAQKRTRRRENGLSQG